LPKNATNSTAIDRNASYSKVSLFLKENRKIHLRNIIVTWHMGFKIYKINFIVIICIWIQIFSGTAEGTSGLATFCIWAKQECGISCLQQRRCVFIYIGDTVLTHTWEFKLQDSISYYCPLLNFTKSHSTELSLLCAAVRMRAVLIDFHHR